MHRSREGYEKHYSAVQYQSLKYDKNIWSSPKPFLIEYLIRRSIFNPNKWCILEHEYWCSGKDAFEVNAAHSLMNVTILLEAEPKGKPAEGLRYINLSEDVIQTVC